VIVRLGGGYNSLMTNPQPYPILEFDPTPQAILNPNPEETAEPLPQRAVLCFFQEILQKLVAEGTLVQIFEIRSEMGSHPVYRLETPSGPVCVAHPGVGAPLAAGILEELIVQGVNRFIACGGCGVLRPDLAAGHPVVLHSAVRDEGTSYHYLPPSREVGADPRASAVLELVLQERGLVYLAGKAWTTDAFYRETNDRRALRLAEGCDVVEMEAAAFFAVAQFRGVSFGQVVYGGDLVVPEGWDDRAWNHRSDDRRLLFDLAVEAVQRLKIECRGV
jgi:uridine phosphorylase